MLSQFDLSRPIAIIDPVMLPWVKWPRDVTDRRSGRRTSKRNEADPRARDHHKLSRAVGLVSSRVASPRRGSERDASVAIYLPLPLLISRDVPTRRSSSRTHNSYCPLFETVAFSCRIYFVICLFFFNIVMNIELKGRLSIDRRSE